MVGSRGFRFWAACRAGSMDGRPFVTAEQTQNVETVNAFLFNVNTN